MTPKFHSLKVVSVDPVAEDAVCVALSVPGDLRDAYRFSPGQHLTLKAEIQGHELRRPYSICSSPNDPLLKVGVREIPGGAFSGFVNQELKAGASIDVMTPQGKFTADGLSDTLLIAAGSGITPLLSIARDKLESGSRVCLVYGNRYFRSVMFLDELNQLKDRYMDSFALIHALSRESRDDPASSGRIDGEKIKRLADSGVIEASGLEGVFICGPGEMTQSLGGTLEELGVTRERIHTELFTPGEGTVPRKPGEKPASVKEGVSVEIIMDGTRHRFNTTDGDVSIIDAAKRHGLELPYSCKNGMCCTCRSKVVSGRVELPVNFSLEDWEIEGGFTLACVAKPVTDEVVLDFDAR